MAFFTTKDGTRIFYKDWGPKDAQPIVFHHGWPLSADDWDAQMLYFLDQGFRVVAHERLRKIGAIRSPVDIPSVIAEHLAEVGEIGGALGRIVGAEVNPGSGEAAVAGGRRRQMGALGCLGIETQAKQFSGEVIGR